MAGEMKMESEKWKVESGKWKDESGKRKTFHFPLSTFRLLVVFLLSLALASCGSQKHFGQRKAPKDCHTCTRWSK